MHIAKVGQGVGTTANRGPSICGLDTLSSSMLRSSSPLTELDSSSPLRSATRIDAQFEDQPADESCADSEVASNSDSVHDSTYLLDADPLLTSTGTPLHNKPYGQNSISSASARRLDVHGYKSNTCILTRQTTEMGVVIERPHMIAQATKGREVTQAPLTPIPMY
jgi:hypothetical protein